jgi:hypothetical protein
LCSLAAIEGFTATPRAVALGIAPNILMAALFFFYRDYRSEQTIAWIFGALGLLVWLSYVNAWLAIVGLTTSFPLQDARFMAWSEAVGLDYRAFLGWIAERPKLGPMLNAAYRLSVPMIFIAPVVLAMTGQFQRLRTFVSLYAILLTVSVVISIVAPAKGFAVYAPLPAELSHRLPEGASVFYARTMEAYRSGTLRIIDPSHLEGVVVFPSFHTAMALMTIYAFWRTRIVWAIGLAVNGLVLLSIIPIGGHYVWDMIGAAVLFVAAERSRAAGPARQSPALANATQRPLDPRSSAVACRRRRAPVRAPAPSERAAAGTRDRPDPRVVWRPCPFRRRSGSECREFRSATRSPAPRRH